LGKGCGPSAEALFFDYETWSVRSAMSGDVKFADRQQLAEVAVLPVR
jgi:hypothetical protein